MVTCVEIVHYLHDFLKCDTFADYAPNGLQIEGVGTLKRIATAVTASEDVIQKAIQGNADALIVHHGYFWKGENPVIQGMKKQRISRILKHDMNLLAYHLPIDCHVELGNNACIAKLLAVDAVKMQDVQGTKNLLWSGTFSQAISAKDLRARLNNLFTREALHIEGNDRLISSIAWCSGAAQDFIEAASKLGVDAYLSGEVSERTYYQAKELGIHYYGCGHHATERWGIQALGQHLSRQFALEHWFIDSDNPI